MDQHGLSGISDSDSSAGGSVHPQTRSVASSAFTSEPPTRAGPSSHFYTHPARTSTLSANGGLLRGPTSGLASAAPGGENNEMDDTVNGTANHHWPRMGASLPSFSRRFDTFMAEMDENSSLPRADDGFFVPSYLSKSTHVRKLKEAHEARIQAQTELKLSSPNGASSNGVGFPQLLPAGSHRGMSHNVVERPPPFEEDDAMEPLPTRWNKDDMWPGIEILPDGRSVEFTGPRNPSDRDHEASAVRADHYMPPQCGIYYYEVSIMHGKRDDTTIAIGFSTKNAATSRPVGWEPESWAYHGDDGRCFTGQNIGRPFGPTYTTGDVVGCGVNFRDHTAFFTKNGVKIGKSTLSVDLFLQPREQKNKIRADIQNTDISRLEPGLGETDLIHALVLQFLQHDGYVETARAFAKDIKQQKEALRLDPNVTVDGINIKDDEDANNRQREFFVKKTRGAMDTDDCSTGIRRAILEGDIDRALKLTNAYYPQVFRDNEEMHFKLRCRKFIELVRMAAQLRAGGEPKKSNGNGPTGVGISQDMDVDGNGADGMSWNETMETEAVDTQPEMMKLEQEMLDYGRTLGAEYANDARPEISKALGEIWALVAYANPLKEPKVSHLLGRKGRVAVAEELNSAILSSLGKSSRASLEKLFAQTSVLLEDLRADGGSGAFVAVQDVVDFVRESVPLSPSLSSS
ncbi:hypothetical protein EsDP_00006181 [Epichloe bromicola]|uniref:Protein SSH4 n=1 Tax=Epichloe bromicola TaxID=79588 RepID=A0ABQ0CWU4_9HYPO